MQKHDGGRGSPIAVAVCYHKSVRGRETQVGKMEGDGPESQKTQTPSLEGQ